MVGTELWAKMDAFGKAFGKFQFGMFTRKNNQIDFLLGADRYDISKPKSCDSEHDLRYIVCTLTSILGDDLWIDVSGFEVALMDINMDLYVDHQVSMDVIYHDVTKAIFRMFANLMDNRSGWLSKTSVCPRPKPLQLIAALDKSKIDKSLPSTTQDVARQCIKIINDAKKTGVSNGHIDTEKVAAQYAFQEARLKEMQSKLQSVDKKLQNLGQQGLGQQVKRDRSGKHVSFAPDGGASYTLHTNPSAALQDLVAYQAATKAAAGGMILPPGIAPAPEPEPAPGAGGRVRKPMRKIGVLTAEFVTAWRDLALDRSKLHAGPPRCIFKDIASVPGYSAWGAKCTELGAAEHKKKNWWHAGDANPRPAADGHNALVATFPVADLQALLTLFSVPTAP